MPKRKHDPWLTRIGTDVKVKKGAKPRKVVYGCDTYCLDAIINNRKPWTLANTEGRYVSLFKRGFPLVFVTYRKIDIVSSP